MVINESVWLSEFKFVFCDDNFCEDGRRMVTLEDSTHLITEEFLSFNGKHLKIAWEDVCMLLANY